MKKKIILILICVFLALIVIASLIGFWNIKCKDTESKGGAFDVVGKVTVTDGVRDTTGFTKEFIIEDSGTYCFYVEWNAQEGLITGINIMDETGKNITAFTAESMYMETFPMELKAGTYTADINFLTDAESAVAFCESAKIEQTTSLKEYAYKKNGTWETTYHVSWKECMQENVVLKICLVGGLLLGGLATVVILTLTKKGEELTGKFDERQEIARGRAFKYSFYTLMGGNIVLAVLDLLEIQLFSRTDVSMFISIFIAIGVFACTCIWNDAYFALNEKRGSLMVIFALVGIMNIVVAVRIILSGTLIQEGALSQFGLNLLGGIVFIVIFIVMWLKRIKERKEEQE